MVIIKITIEIKSEEDLWENEDEKVPLSENVSKRLAVMNLDWDKVTAEDLMTVFSSFCKEKNCIKKVEIYPSSFGKEKMKNDSLYGPQGIWKNSLNEQRENDKLSDKEEENDNDEGLNEEEKSESDDGNDDPTKPAKSIKPITKPNALKRENKHNDFDPIALRKYELQKLRYFFAIIYCDSVGTAQYIYDEYDGFEYENSSLKLDLRFVPNDTKFPNPPKDVCTKLNPKHELKGQLINSALQSSNVKLTWEAPDDKRYEMISKNLSLEKLEEMDLKEYLGSESDEEEDVNKYRKLITYEAEEGRKGKAKDVQITFKSGLEEISESDNEEMKPEKKKKNKKDKKGKHKRNEDVITKEQQELELLIDKKRSTKDFKTNLDDERFSALYNDKRFLIDPSSKDYKKASKDVKQMQIKKRKIETH